jgi:hypothetical protein
LIVLAVFAFIDRADLTTAALSVVHDDQCNYERMFTSDFVGPNIPKFAVVSTPEGCIVKPLDSRIK